jgi:uncharacterized protein (TIGR03905 family)
MTYVIHPKGTCSRRMTLEIEGGVIRSLKVDGGCSGNLQGIAKLVQGMTVEQVIEKLDGIRWGFKCTSCPDQLAKGLKTLADSPHTDSK